MVGLRSSDRRMRCSELLTAASFGVEDSQGLSAFFTAPTGTTDTQLASLFADTISSLPGYSASALDNSVTINIPANVAMYLTVDGNPFSYEIGAVPEPESAALATMAVVVLAAYALRARSARRGSRHQGA
jgi:hypothetical protein